MIRGNLNYNESLVLYGLVKYPLLNDRQLADRINLKMTTATAIKNRLKENEYYATVRVPILRPDEIELFTVLMIKFSARFSVEELVNIRDQYEDEFPELFFGGLESGGGFSLGFANNFSELSKMIEKFSSVLIGGNFVENNRRPMDHLAIFPLKNAIFFNFFDFSDIIKRDFKIKLEDEPSKPRTSLPKTKNVTLSNIEKRVLYGLVNYPELPDSKIADKINVTRQVISKLKKTFEDDGLMKTIRMPDLSKLGYEILVLVHNNHNPLTPMEKRQKGIELVLSELPIIFLISTNLESFAIAPAKNFVELQSLKNKVLRFYKKENFFISEPKLFLYSISNMTFTRRNFYGPLLKKIFKIKDEDLNE
jgi:DNA-binding MarR family transcriptional regulator